jgi:hypothetical protein
MKEPNLPENQLRGWHPRRPSAELKERIFHSSTDDHALLLNWTRLAPAMACVFLVMLMIHLNAGNFWSERSAKSMTATNLGLVYYDAEGGQVAQNHLSSVTFDWTNHNGFRSSIGFAPTTNLSN